MHQQCDTYCWWIIITIDLTFGVEFIPQCSNRNTEIVKELCAASKIDNYSVYFRITLYCNCIKVVAIKVMANHVKSEYHSSRHYSDYSIRFYIFSKFVVSTDDIAPTRHNADHLGLQNYVCLLLLVWQPDQLWNMWLQPKIRCILSIFKRLFVICHICIY